MRKNKIKLILLQVIGIIFLLAPIITVFIINRNVYFKTVKDSINISLGAILGLIVLIFVLSGKSKMLKGYTGLIIGLLIIYFLNSIIQDLLIIYFSIVIGETIYRFIFTPFINKYKKINSYQYEQYYKEQAKTLYQDDLKKQIEKEEAKKQKKLGSV
ncbi:MAG: hypothetical protein ACI4WW_02555 [Candidatus Coprovivens sp.]